MNTALDFQSTEMLRGIVNALPAHVAVVDHSGTILYVNDAWTRFADENGGHAVKAGVGESYLQVCDRAAGEDAGQAKEVATALRRILSGRSHQFALEYACHSPAEQRWFRVLIAPMTQPALGAILMHVDVTERKQTEMRLHQSEERFRQMAENIQEVFWMADLQDHRLIYLSPGYEVIWGRPVAEALASYSEWANAVHPEDRERVRAGANALINGGKDFNVEFRIVRPDGSVRWIFDRAFPIRDGEGRVYRAAGVAWDITDRKEAEQQIKKQAALLDKAQDAILVKDLMDRVVFWNKSAERLFGWTADEARGRRTNEFLYGNVEEAERAKRSLMEKGDWSGELQKLAKNGRKIWVETRWTLVRDDNGQPNSILAINTDITEKKRLEAQFLRAQRLESLGTLAGGIAHDLNNVLAPITMALAMLRGELTEAEKRELIDTLEQSAERGTEMVKQVLAFARGVEGQRIAVAPRHIFKEIQKIIRDTFPKSIKVETRSAQGCWNILGDPTQVHQVILNLAVNSRDAMACGGTLTLSAENAVFDESYAAMNSDCIPGRYVVLAVADTGTGIPRDHMDRIFDPFFTTKEIGKGTGLGLATVSTIARSHGGFVNVYSEPGRGTTFKVYFPAIESDANALVPDGALHLPRGNGECVLVIDDEAGVRSIARKTMERFGYRVRTAANGAEGVAEYAQHRDEIDVVLTDMMMPIMDGPATILALRNINPKLKIIAASGLHSNFGVARAADARVEHFLPKPYTAEAMLQVLHEALRPGRGQGQGSPDHFEPQGDSGPERA